MPKQLTMNEAQLAEFEKTCLDHLPFKNGKMITSFLNQFVVEIPSMVVRGEIDKPGEKS